MPRPINPDRARIEIVASPEQRKLWERAAKAEDLTLSQWVRRALDAAAKKRTRNPTTPANHL